jgi:hypothetical protein
MRRLPPRASLACGRRHPDLRYRGHGVGPDAGRFLGRPGAGRASGSNPPSRMSLSPRPGQFKVVKLNIDEAPEIGDRYDVRSIPALLVP